MTMAEAKEKLMALASGRPHSVYYELVDNGDGTHYQSCTVQIGRVSATEDRWEKALEELVWQISGGNKITEDVPLSSKTIRAA